MSDRAAAAELVRALKRRPGRGGVRLTYEQADLALALIAAGARAVDREVRARTAGVGGLRRVDLDDLELAEPDVVDLVRETLRRSTAPPDDPLRKEAEQWARL